MSKGARLGIGGSLLAALCLVAGLLAGHYVFQQDHGQSLRMLQKWQQMKAGRQPRLGIHKVQAYLDLLVDLGKARRLKTKGGYDYRLVLPSRAVYLGLGALIGLLAPVAALFIIRLVRRRP